MPLTQCKGLKKDGKRCTRTWSSHRFPGRTLCIAHEIEPALTEYPQKLDTGDRSKSNEPSAAKASKAGWSIGGIAAVVPPGAIVALFGGDAFNSVLSVSGLIVYELCAIALGIGIAVSRNLRARWVSRLSESLDQKILLVLSGNKNRYRSYMIASHSYVDLTGLTTRGEFTLSLTEIFTSLRLDVTALNMFDSDPVRQKLAETEQNDVWHWLRLAQDRRSPLVVIGPPGSGKTTMAKHVAFVLAGKKWEVSGGLKKLPVLLFLRDHKECFATGHDPGLAELIASSLSRLQLTNPTLWIEENLRKGRFVVMLDGLDEVPVPSTRKNLASWVEDQRKTYPETTIVLTSRPFGYSQNPLEVAVTLQIAPFSFSDIDSFLRKWYSVTEIRSHGADNAAAELAATRGADDLLQRLRRNSHLHELAVNPLLLTMTANVHKYRGALPGSRSELYKEICEVFLGKRHEARGVAVDMTASQRQVVLEHLALTMMSHGSRDVTLSVAEDLLGEVLARIAPDVSVGEFMRRTEQASGLLLEREAGIFSFAHLTFQEYLAAVRLRSLRDAPESLEGMITNAWWYETLRLYSSLGDATAVIEACLENLTDKSLRLAIDCLMEAREVQPKLRKAFARLSSTSADSSIDDSRLAATIRILMRPSSFVPVNEDAFLTLEPIMGCEYDLFLSENDTTGIATAPRHWVGYDCPPQLRDSPVTGIDFRSAEMFVRWLGRNTRDGWSYRIPTTEELRTHFANLQAPTSSSALAVQAASHGRLQFGQADVYGKDSSDQANVLQLALRSVREDVAHLDSMIKNPSLVPAFFHLMQGWGSDEPPSTPQVVIELQSLLKSERSTLARIERLIKQALEDCAVREYSPVLLSGKTDRLLRDLFGNTRLANEFLPEQVAKALNVLLSYGYDNDQLGADENDGARRLNAIRQNLGMRTVRRPPILRQTATDDAVLYNIRLCMLATANALLSAPGVRKKRAQMPTRHRRFWDPVDISDVARRLALAYVSACVIDGERAQLYKPSTVFHVARVSGGVAFTSRTSAIFSE